MKNDKLSFKPINVRSNHFPVNFNKNFFNITEWYVKIFARFEKDGANQLEKYKVSPSIVTNELEEDSRIKRREVYGNCRSDIMKVIGKHFMTGT